MTYRKRTTAIQVRVTEQEKRKLERQAKRCGLSLSGYLRRVGTGEPVAAFHSQRFHELYRQVNGLRDDPTTQPMERTAAQLDELAGLILTAYTSGGCGRWRPLKSGPPRTALPVWWTTPKTRRKPLTWICGMFSTTPRTKKKTVERTERAMFVTGVNCNRDTAFQEMQAVKERFGLQEKKRR